MTNPVVDIAAADDDDADADDPTAIETTGTCTADGAASAESCTERSSVLQRGVPGDISADIKLCARALKELGTPCCERPEVATRA
jgi:hypothetical protein